MNEVGNNDYLSDTIGSLKFEKEQNNILYNFRFDNDQNKIRNHDISSLFKNKYG